MSYDARSVSSTRHVDDSGAFASPGEIDTIATLDIAGHPGAAGSDGNSHHQPPLFSGGDGYPGGDATPAADGGHAGQVRLRLNHGDSDRDSGALQISGELDAADGSVRQIEQRLLIGSDGYLFIEGGGGRGGNGGRGGDGGPGARGSDGSDATRFSSGSDGGPGGDGGDAGDPSDGGHGGDGGRVTLEVHSKELGLLMLVRGNLAGGDIGFAGESGLGGPGGPGGRGGSSYSWTESESYTDHEGKRRTRTVSHSNPGGSNGRPGRPGAPSRYQACDGHPGAAGQLQILVRDSRGGPLRFAAPYDLELVTFDIASETAILEPDSLISVDRLTVRNCGGMPTPPNYTIRIFVPSDRAVQWDGVELVMHRSLAPGECATFDHHSLRARLADYLVTAPRNRSYRLRHQISPRARMESGIGREFDNFENSESITVQFPIELTPITSLHSLAPGESTRVLWNIKNIGQEKFSQQYLDRSVQSRIRLLGGDLDTTQIAFWDADDQPFDLLHQPLALPSGELLPGQSKQFETRIGIRADADAVPYQEFQFAIDIDLQRPRSSAACEQYRCVDSRKTFVRISERYSREPDARFLLIANKETTAADIENWTTLAGYFGTSLDVWDVSYYGFLDLVRAVDRDQSLLQQWAGMTIIIPNNYYQTPAGHTVAFAQLARAQFLKAAADHDINFYIVGDSRSGGESLLSTALVPVDEHPNRSGLRTPGEFLQAVGRWHRYIERTSDVVGGVTGDARTLADVSLGATHQFDIDKRTFLFQPQPDWLQQYAEKLQRKLYKHDPLHRWIIVHRYDTGDTDTSWGWFRRRNVGTLEVRRTLDSSKGSAVLYEVPSIDAIDRDFIHSQANKHGIFLALKFEDKVDRFIRLVSERTFPRYSERYVDRPLSDDEVRQIGGELVDSILTDLFNEQRVARNCKTWGPTGIRALMPKLNYLAERSLNYGVTYSQMQQQDTTLQLLYELLAHLRYMAWQSMTVWDSAWIPTSLLKRSRAVSMYMVERTERIMTNIFGRDPSWWDKFSSRHDGDNPFGGAKKRAPAGIARRTAAQAVADQQQRLRDSDTSLATYTTAQDHPGLTYDSELLTQASQRVMSGKEYDQLVAAEQRAIQIRRETERSVRGQRDELLVPIAKTTPTATATTTATAT